MESWVTTYRIAPNLGAAGLCRGSKSAPGNMGGSNSRSKDHLSVWCCYLLFVTVTPGLLQRSCALLQSMQHTMETPETCCILDT